MSVNVSHAENSEATCFDWINIIRIGINYEILYSFCCIFYYRNGIIFQKLDFDLLVVQKFSASLEYTISEMFANIVV